MDVQTRSPKLAGLPYDYGVRAFIMIHSPFLRAVFATSSCAILAGPGAIGLVISCPGPPLMAVRNERAAFRTVLNLPPDTDAAPSTLSSVRRRRQRPSGGLDLDGSWSFVLRTKLSDGRPRLRWRRHKQPASPAGNSPLRWLLKEGTNLLSPPLLGQFGDQHL